MQHCFLPLTSQASDNPNPPPHERLIMPGQVLIPQTAASVPMRPVCFMVEARLARMFDMGPIYVGHPEGQPYDMGQSGRVTLVNFVEEWTDASALASDLHSYVLRRMLRPCLIQPGEVVHFRVRNRSRLAHMFLSTLDGIETDTEGNPVEERKTL